jgi:hypothetical protein
VSFFIHFGSLGATLLSFEHWWVILQILVAWGATLLSFEHWGAILQTTGSLGGLCSIFPKNI